MTWKQALTRAINAEVAAEQAATQAEATRRQTWWATTWALASVPRAEWGEAQAEYVRLTNHSKDHANVRRTTGARLTEVGLATNLPQPRFAIVASKWIGKDGNDAKTLEAIKLLTDAEHNEQSLREFSLALTGKSWTNAPENMTEAEEDEVVKKVARKRPAVIAKEAEKEEVADEIVKRPKAKASVKEATAKQQDEALEKIGISRKQRAERKAALQAAGKAAAAGGVAQEWENESPTVRGNVLLASASLKVHGSTQEFFDFLTNKVDKTIAWDADHGAETIDLIDSTIELLESCKALVLANIEAQAMDTVPADWSS